MLQPWPWPNPAVSSAHTSTLWSSAAAQANDILAAILVTSTKDKERVRLLMRDLQRGRNTPLPTIIISRFGRSRTMPRQIDIDGVEVRGCEGGYPLLGRRRPSSLTVLAVCVA